MYYIITIWYELNISETNKFFAQQMHYFLFSYFDEFNIRLLFQKNKIMKYVMETNNYYENNHKPNASQINWLQITENPLMYDNKGGSLTPQPIHI